MKKYKELTEAEKKSVQKKFGQLLEYSFITKQDDLLLDEDDELDPQLGGEQSPEMPAEPIDGTTVPGESPEMSVDTQSDNQLPGMQEPAQAPMPAMDPAMGMPNEPIQPENGEVEIDVTQLTNDQKEASDKINALTDQTSQVMDLLSVITSKVDAITSKIEADNESIRQEIEKRNPTPKEILQKRQTLGDPFNQTPEDFWKQKEAEGQYELSDDEKTDLQIKASDLDDSPMNVYKSFGLKDGEVNQTLRGVMGY